MKQLDKKYNDEKQRENLRNIIETEKNNLLEKYLKIKDEFIVKNQLLYKQCEAIEKIGKEIKKCEIDKNKRRQQMQDWLFNLFISFSFSSNFLIKSIIIFIG